MANTNRREAAERAISRAVELNPTVLRVDEDFFVVASSEAGRGYLLERDPQSGDLFCPCPAAQFNGTCYHRAALGIFLGTIPQSWLPPVDAPVAYAVAS